MALKLLRDNLRHLKFILWGVVIVFVLLVFVDWGAGRSGNVGGANVAIRVGDREVTHDEFLRQMRQQDDMFKQRFGEQWDQLRTQFNLAEQTAATLIERELMLEEAGDMGLEVSDRELQERILDNPNFQDENGAFVGAERYERLVRAYYQLTPEQFERLYAEDLAIGKLTELVRQSVFVGEDEAVEALRREREFADFDAVLVRFENALSEVQLDDADVTTYYEANAEDFRRDEERVIRYLVVETARLQRLMPVEDDELRSYYDEHREEFRVGEQARASHILFRVAPGADATADAEAQAAANGVAEIARRGVDFAQLAQQHSDDPGSKDNGGDLGWFGRGQMVPEFEQAVFGAKPGEIVGPIKSQYGYHLIRVDGFRPERVQPFEEVEAQVRTRVLEGRAAAEAERRAGELARRLETETPTTEEAWQAIADEDEAVVLNQSPPVAAGEQVPGTGQDATFTADVFAAEPTVIHGPKAIPRGWMVWQLAEVRPEGVPPLDEIRREVEQRLRRERALERTLEKGRELAAALAQSDDVAATAESFEATVSTALDHRRGQPVPGIGSSAALDAALFAAAEGDVVGPVAIGDRGAVVARIESLRRVDATELTGEIDATRERLAAERADRLLRSMVNSRRRDTVVTVDNELIERFAPRS
jgi:peptidyl-prolyl cis-trans isomerase D